MNASASAGRSTYSPSLACHLRYRPFWIDARKGCRFSASDRQKMRDRAKIRNERGVIVDRHPAFRSLGEDRRTTRLARKGLAATLLAQHEARPRAVADPVALRRARARYILAEAVETLRCGLRGAELARHLAQEPELHVSLRELERLREACE